MFAPIKRFRGSSRRAKIITSITAGLLVPALAFAAAFYAFNLSVGGSVNSGVFKYTLGSPSLQTVSPPAGQSDICASVALNGTTGITITPPSTGGGLPGDTCSIMVTPIADSGNTTTGKVAGLVLPGLPKGWTAKLDTTVTNNQDSGTLACGTAVSSSGVHLALVISVDPAGTAVLDGSSYDLGAGEIQIAPTAQYPASPVCTIAGTQ